ncbi:MAG: glycosyltransferase [Caldilineaceae bacterium]|nr:glycosyltransferase [Caldilineaceae bacterium]
MRFAAIAALQILYTISVIGLALYGIQALWLTVCTLQRFLLSSRRGWLTAPLRSVSHDAALPVGDGTPSPTTDPHPWPAVTVQLPIYNERHVIERLINACAHLDYPREKLQIQVLDDSDDLTTAIAARAVEQWQQQGVAISLVRRPTRAGFKAGALAHGLAEATGEYIAIFDADFVPKPDFLRRTILCFYKPAPARKATPDENPIGFVQARWAHLNAAYSPLTTAQALALDGHFVVEQGGRQWAGWAMGFNGSGGIWRRRCIEDPSVGGWQADTLCEDLDLSYRAQLANWQPHYRNDIEAPAEVPPQLVAFKRQQFRWAKGSIQTLRKMGPRVWQSDWSFLKRVAAVIHLGSYLIHPLLLLLLLTSLPLLLLNANPGAHIALLSTASLGPPLLYAVGQGALYGRGWWRQWRFLPLLTLIGTGICFSNTLAVVQGFSNHHGPFLRTPKFHVEAQADGWLRSSYRLPIDSSLLGELCCFLYALLTVTVAFHTGNWMFGIYLLLYVGGFGLMLVVSLWQARPIPLVRPSRSSTRRSHRPLSP